MKDFIVRFAENASDEQALDIYDFIQCQYNLCYDKDKEELKILADWDCRDTWFLGRKLNGEQRTFNPLVVGSTPMRPTIFCLTFGVPRAEIESH